uniref:Uncharacterized protein n=1 Tax=Eutreptiella gymnastica TaxID=73025 RepID=A0A7S1IYT0_9EUGL
MASGPTCARRIARRPVYSPPQYLSVYLSSDPHPSPRMPFILGSWSQACFHDPQGIGFALPLKKHSEPRLLLAPVVCSGGSVDGPVLRAGTKAGDPVRRAVRRKLRFASVGPSQHGG